MRLYAGTSTQFVQDTAQNQIAEKLRLTFFEHFQYNPSPAEITSWRNSLRAVSDVFREASLDDHGVILEYQLPLSSRRLDCMICGKDERKEDAAVILELKQWEKCQESMGENEVLTWVGGAERDILHPSVQVSGYKMYLKDTHTAFYEGERPVQLDACSYLHNYNHYSDDVIYAEKFKDAIHDCPVFTADDFEKLCDYLAPKLKEGEGIEVLNRIEGGRFRPSKKLMDHVGNVIKGNPEYVLLDEQLVVYDKVFALVRKGFHDKQKNVFVVKGGPGTGKSVIALNLMADLLSRHYNTHYATGSKAFTETLRRIIGRRGAWQFRYFNSYATAKPNEIDVLLCDEAHRIRETSNSRWTPKSRRSNVPQIEELLRAGKVSVFFIDDNQNVRPYEIGSSEHISQAAQKHNCKIHHHQLDVQFRCSGSEAFVGWVNNTLGIQKTANVIWNEHEEFDFRILASPLQLENAIKEKLAKDFSARMTAGYCWYWSKDLDHYGGLKNDVVIGDYVRPWNARHDAIRLPPDVPKAHYWAYDPNGINQIGCVYTAQGFEFDYVGVIFGNDLTYDLDEQRWEGHPENSEDPVVRKSKGEFTRLTKNTYRVLLSRGMKGCYVYFMDKDTERFVKSRIQH